jgi:hypothetical protein
MFVGFCRFIDDPMGDWGYVTFVDMVLEFVLHGNLPDG